MSDPSTSSAALQARVSACFADRALLADPDHRAAVLQTIALLDRGALRVASPDAAGEWTVHAWVKQAILLFFATQELRTIELGPFEFHDKIPLKKGLAAAGVRVVPPGVVRYGAHVERGAPTDAEGIELRADTRGGPQAERPERGRDTVVGDRDRRSGRRAERVATAAPATPDRAASGSR